MWKNLFERSIAYIASVPSPVKEVGNLTSDNSPRKHDRDVKPPEFERRTMGFKPGNLDHCQCGTRFQAQASSLGILRRENCRL